MTQYDLTVAASFSSATNSFLLSKIYLKQNKTKQNTHTHTLHLSQYIIISHICPLSIGYCPFNPFIHSFFLSFFSFSYYYYFFCQLTKRPLPPIIVCHNLKLFSLSLTNYFIILFISSSLLLLLLLSSISSFYTHLNCFS